MNKRVQLLQEKLEEYNRENTKLEKIISTYNAIFTLITSLSTIIIIYFGGLEVIQGVMTYAQIMIMIDYASYLTSEFS